METQNTNFGDREILDDLLNSQKLITGVYNTYSNECVNPQLQNDFLDILRDEHNIQFTVYNDMQKRSWYSTEAAQSQKVNETKTKFEDVAAQL